MSYFEMFVAVLAVVLFSTVVLLMNRTMLEQNDLLINASTYMQASHLSHSILDEVDSKLFSKQLKFAQIKTTYTTTRTYNLPHTGGVWTAQISAVDCDSLGIPLTTPVTNNIYVRVLVRTSTTGLKNPVLMQRVYTKTNLNI